MVYLFDSDVLIEHLRKRKHLREYLPELGPADKICCSVISTAEVYAGMLPSEEKSTRELLESLIHLPVTKEVAEKAAQIKKVLRKKGHNIYLDDCLIAASAELEGAVLVTLNQKHYPTVSQKLP